MTKFERQFRNGLKEREYKKYAPSKIDPEHVVALYQKCIRDDEGKRYFIDIYEWDFSWWDDMPRKAKDKYMFEAELSFNMKDTDKPVRIKMFCGWTLDEIEQYAETLWNSGLYEYYEA